MNYRELLLFLSFLLSLTSFSRNILVKNADELNKATKTVLPGDTILLKNGTWNNSVLQLDCSGTEQQPVYFRAQYPGKVIMNGTSSIMIGGNYLVIEGLLFNNGLPSPSGLIQFRLNGIAANNCRLTQCVFNGSNKNYTEEEIWISLYGKGNRVDHCSFIDKKNTGSLIMINMDREFNRDNFHSVDHNYFGSLSVSEGQAIICVGSTGYEEFNAHTQISDNVFENCPGETDLLFFWSGSNVLRDNIFRECSGRVVLAGGKNNTVVNNLFLGHPRKNAGGLYVEGSGQWVINNLFHQVRSVASGSPLVFAATAKRDTMRNELPAPDLLFNNSFYECTPLSFQAMDSMQKGVQLIFARNILYNTRDSVVYQEMSQLSPFYFEENMLNLKFPQVTRDGFIKSELSVSKTLGISIPSGALTKNRFPVDSLTPVAVRRGITNLKGDPGFKDAILVKKLLTAARTGAGASWLRRKN